MFRSLDVTLRVPAKLQRFEEPRIANVGTVIKGLGYHPESPGVVHFAVDGQSYRLEAYASKQARNTTKCFTTLRQQGSSLADQR